MYLVYGLYAAFNEYMGLSDDPRKNVVGRLFINKFAVIRLDLVAMDFFLCICLVSAEYVV